MRNNPFKGCSGSAENSSPGSAIYDAGSFGLVTPAAFLNSLNFDGPSYCRYLWSWHAKKPWQAVGHRSRNRPVTTLAAFKSDATGWCAARSEKLSSLDLFYTPNEFFDWRNTRQLAQLHCNWLEIDTSDHEILDADIMGEVLEQLSVAGMPIPSGIVRSGSGGLHVYWIYDGCPAYRNELQRWRQITDALISAVRGGADWHVDTAASRDPARVLRLPGSVHGGSGRLVTGYSSGVLYTLESLAVAVGLPAVPTPAPIYIVKPKQTKPLPSKPSPSAAAASGRHTIRGWWSTTYWHIVTSLRKQRAQHGRRDLTAFILFVALRHMHDDDQAEQTITALNNELIGLPDKELHANLQTARRVRYRYKKATLAAYLTQIGIDAAFLYPERAAKRSPDAIHAAQSEAGVRTSASRRHETLERLTAAANDMVQGRVLPTVSAVAAAAGRSVRTVQRYWSQLLALMDDKRCAF